MAETIDVKHVASGDRFTGSLVAPVVVGNTVAVPAGSAATGEVLVAHRRGMFKGQSVMALTLTQLEVNGTQYHIDTGTLARTKKGKGRRSAAFIGGGAGMGMLIGGVATGGVGLLVGGLAGGGAGALGAALQETATCRFRPNRWSPSACRMHSPLRPRRRWPDARAFSPQENGGKRRSGTLHRRSAEKTRRQA